MATFATIEDFEERHGNVPDDQAGIVEALLDDASALITDEAEDSESEWLEGGSAELPAAIVGVCVAAAFRAWRNPEGLSARELGSSVYRYRGDSADALFLTARECRIVRRAASRSTFRSTTLVSPYSGDVEVVNDLPLDEGS